MRAHSCAARMGHPESLMALAAAWRPSALCWSARGGNGLARRIDLPGKWLSRRCGSKESGSSQHVAFPCPSSAVFVLLRLKNLFQISGQRLPSSIADLFFFLFKLGLWKSKVIVSDFLNLAFIWDIGPLGTAAQGENRGIEMSTTA